MPLTVRKISRKRQDPIDFVVWLQTKRFIESNRHCECGDALNLQIRNKEPEGVCSRCATCRKIYSVRSRSFFEGCRIPIADILIIAVCFIKLKMIEDAASLAHVRRHTASAYYAIFRQLIGEDIAMEPIAFEDDHGIYEADETYYRHVATSEGAMIDRQWVAGCLERGTGKCRLYTIADRTAGSLVPKLHELVPAGALICTDSLASYNGLPPRNIHRTVNHSAGEYSREEDVEAYGLVNIHTNKIERKWKTLKRLVMNKKCRTLAHMREYMNVLEFVSDRRDFFELIKFF